MSRRHVPNPWDIGSNVRPFSLPGPSSNPYLVGKDGIAVPSIPLSCLKVPTVWSSPDGLWISTFDCNGLVGLSLLYVVMELPVIFFLVRFPVHLWRDPLVAPAMVAAALLGIYMVDCLLNSFANIVYVSLASGLVGVTPMQFGISSKGLYRAKRMPDRASFPPQPNTVEVQSRLACGLGREPDGRGRPVPQIGTESKIRGALGRRLFGLAAGIRSFNRLDTAFCCF